MAGQITITKVVIVFVVIAMVFLAFLTISPTSYEVEKNARLDEDEDLNADFNKQKNKVDKSKPNLKNLNKQDKKEDKFDYDTESFGSRDYDKSSDVSDTLSGSSDEDCRYEIEDLTRENDGLRVKISEHERTIQALNLQILQLKNKPSGTPSEVCTQAPSPLQLCSTTLKYHNTYKPWETCPSQKVENSTSLLLLKTRNCPRPPLRRCVTLIPQDYKEPVTGRADRLYQLIPDASIDWKKFDTAKSIQNIKTETTNGKNTFPRCFCNDCFDLNKERTKWEAQVEKHKSYLDEFRTIEWGIDINPKTGGFAAEILEKYNKLIVSYGNDICGLPFQQTIAYRGLPVINHDINLSVEIPENSVDLVHVNDLDPIINVTDFEALFGDWDRILRPGGYLWIEKFHLPSRWIFDRFILSLNHLKNHLKYEVQHFSADIVEDTMIKEKDKLLDNKNENRDDDDDEDDSGDDNIHTLDAPSSDVCPPDSCYIEFIFHKPLHRPPPTHHH